jgi:pyruvate formate lyase activating enzyme
VAAWVCGLRGPGCKNLAVFFRACSFNCLFCQNWTFKDWPVQPRSYTPEELASLVDRATACICYFGGDPAPQSPFSILASRRALERRGDVRICWETNGSENPSVMNTMAELALRSGGIIKVDLKAISGRLHRALTGSSNEWTLENIRRLAALMPRRPDLPLLAVSTLLVPGYVDEEEVAEIARFLRGLDPGIPYSLLAFHPQFFMGDLPPTSRAHAEACYRAAVKAGLRSVRVGNIHLLW